jgi:hypothetical protein
MVLSLLILVVFKLFKVELESLSFSLWTDEEAKYVVHLWLIITS